MLTSGSGGTCTLYPSLIERDKDGTGWHLTPNSEVTYEGEGPTAKMHYNNSRFEDPDYHPLRIFILASMLTEGRVIHA